MGIPRRDGGGGTFQVNIRPLVKTCPDESGIGELDLPDGSRVVMTGLHLWPNQDRGLVAALRQYLVDKRPDLVILLGGILNEEAFKQVADSTDRMRKMIASRQAPEITRIRNEHEGLEDRFLALAAEGGKYIADFAEASSGHVIYIPSVPSATGQLPNELGLIDFVLAQKEKLDKWAEKHPDEAVEGPPIPVNYADFLGLADNPNVTVMPFGSALRINGNQLVMVGDFRRRNPGSASQEAQRIHQENVWQSFDGKVASSWWTTPVDSLAESRRNWWQAHEIGNMYDLKQLGFLRKYDLRGKGIWVGTVVGGKLFGTSMPALRGKDGRRSFVIDGVPYDEEQPYKAANTFKVTLPARQTPAQSSASPSKAKATTARKRTSRNGTTRGK
jgi:hypothetical protein